MKHTEGDRAAFEKWVQQEINSGMYGWNLKCNECGDYDHPVIHCAWLGWQASRQATVREVAEWLADRWRHQQCDWLVNELLERYGLDEQGGAQ